MSPPPWYGGMASSSAVLPYRTPMPVGPYTLWPENDVEVAIERLHVHLHVRHGLRAIDQHRDVLSDAPVRSCA